LVNLLQICCNDELDDTVDDVAIDTARKVALQKKIRAVAKMAKYFHDQRAESEQILQLKGIWDSNFSENYFLTNQKMKIFKI